MSSAECGRRPRILECFDLLRETRQAMAGGPIHRHAEDQALPVRLEARLRKSYRPGHVPAFTVDAVFSASAGVTILFGASGAGKSTILYCIAGLLEPEWGRIAIGGEALFDSEARLS